MINEFSGKTKHLLNQEVMPSFENKWISNIVLKGCQDINLFFLLIFNGLLSCMYSGFPGQEGPLFTIIIFGYSYRSMRRRAFW
jgi:hypothetical protein